MKDPDAERSTLASVGVGGRRATLRDVAEKAGVSTAAASKVIRGAYGVSPAMRDRVQTAISELSYRPNAAARGMRGRTYTIGVLVVDIENPFYIQMLDGIRDVLAAADYRVFVGPTQIDSLSQSSMVETFVDHQMDGLILGPTRLSLTQLEGFADGIPLVTIGRRGPAQNFDTVASDDLEGSRLIIEHLVSLGHRHIAHVTHSMSDTDDRLPHRARALGYERAMRDNGLADLIDIVESTWTEQGGEAAARSLLQRGSLPTAVHAGADVAAVGMLNEFWDNGTSVPGEISIAGYDNSPVSGLKPVGLTTIDQSARRLGAIAAQLLLERIRGRKEPRSVLMAPRLIVRTSTGDPRA